jgi:hypothetical protein
MSRGIGILGFVRRGIVFPPLLPRSEPKSTKVVNTDGQQFGSSKKALMFAKVHHQPRPVHIRPSSQHSQFSSNNRCEPLSDNRHEAINAKIFAVPHSGSLHICSIRCLSLPDLLSQQPPNSIRLLSIPQKN